MSFSSSSYHQSRDHSRSYVEDVETMAAAAAPPPPPNEPYPSPYPVSGSSSHHSGFSSSPDPGFLSSESPPSIFPSPPPSSVLPPSNQAGLQPDPGYVNHHSLHQDERQNVGRFQIVEGSPNRVPLTEADSVAGRISPLEESPSSASSASASQVPMHQQPLPDVPRLFSTPVFPNMSVGGDSNSLSILISTLPLRNINISPSAQGCEFTPPKLKWSSTSTYLQANFLVTPLSSAKEGKVKVTYIVSGDDASDYQEPPATSFMMYSEGTPLPLPQSTDYSPTSSDDADGHDRRNRDAFLSTGVPRQSGRFVVIDEELNSSGPDPPPPLPLVSSPLSPENPFDLLSRLQATLQHLMDENHRLHAENARLEQENAELRQRGGAGDYGIFSPPDNRFQRNNTTPSSSPTIPPTKNLHPSQQQQQQQQQHSSHRPRFASDRTGASPASGSSSTSSRSSSSNSPANSPPMESNTLLDAKRSTLPPNFAMPLASMTLSSSSSNSANSTPQQVTRTQSLQQKTLHPSSHSQPAATSAFDSLVNLSATIAAASQPSSASHVSPPKPQQLNNKTPITSQKASPGHMKTSRRKSQEMQQIQRDLLHAQAAPAQNSH